MCLQNKILNVCFVYLLLKTAFSKRTDNKRHFQQNFILALLYFISFLSPAIRLLSNLHTRNPIFQQQNTPVCCHIKQRHVLHLILSSDQRQSATETKPYFDGFCHSSKSYQIIQAFPCYFSFSDIFFHDFLSPSHNMTAGKHLPYTHRNYKKQPEQCRQLI